MWILLFDFDGKFAPVIVTCRQARRRYGLASLPQIDGEWAGEGDEIVKLARKGLIPSGAPNEGATLTRFPRIYSGENLIDLARAIRNL
jgi:hypothetical protein